MGASMFTSCQRTMPVKTPATRMYKVVQTNNETMMPMGKSRCGFLGFLRGGGYRVEFRCTQKICTPRRPRSH